MVNKIKVLHIVQCMGYGGMEGRIARLARGLDQNRFEIHILTLRPAPVGQVELPSYVQHIYFPISSGLHFDRLFALGNFIHKGQYHFVHTHNWSSMFYGILAGRIARLKASIQPRFLAGPNKICSIVLHGEHGLNAEDLKNISPKRLLAQKILARLAQGIVAVNEVIAQAVKQGWKVAPEKIKVIPNGVDLNRFKAPSQISEPVTKMERKEKVFIIGTVARLDAVKNLSCLLQAAQGLLKNHPEIRLKLLWVGDGPLRIRLQEEAQTLGLSEHIEFAGEHKDVENWYPRFTVFTNTSVYEGMSNTLLEAMACGLPLVASDVPGNALWLRENENTLFFPSGNAEMLAEKLLKLWMNPRLCLELGKNNRARAEQDYDNRQFIATYAAMYENWLK